MTTAAPFRRVVRSAPGKPATLPPSLPPLPADKQRALARLVLDFPVFAMECLRILPKAGGAPVPFVLNEAQRFLHGKIEEQLASTGKVRVIVLKGRQQGISTYTEGRYYWRVSHQRGKRAFILTHEDKATQNLFGMVDRYWQHAPVWWRPKLGASNAKELVFSAMESRYDVATAGAKDTGRGGTAQFFHGCLSPESWIVDGRTGSLRRMGEFSVGDEVRTHTGAKAEVSFISRQRKKARTIILKGLGQTPLVATDEHRFWTQDGWRELGQVKPGDCLGFPVAAIRDEGVRWAFRLPGSVRPQGGGTREVGPDEVAPSYELGRILGLFLAEGCIIKQSGSGSPSAVTFAVHEREAERTAAWLMPLSHLFRSVKTATREPSKTVAVTVYGRSFASFVRARCGELDEKRLPAEWSACGEDFARGLVHGYLAGDGHSSKRAGDRRISAPSIRSAITVGMRDALASLGYGWAGIAWRDGAMRGGRNERAQWTLRLTGSGVDRLAAELGWQMPERKRIGDYGDVQVRDGYAWVPIRSISEAAETDVMDFEVAHGDHSYCALHCATHNSEVAFWPHAQQHLAGIGQVVPDMPGTEIVFESTANGTANVFHELWQMAVKGRSDFLPVFVPWFWQAEYQTPPPEGWELTDEERDYAEAFGISVPHMVWRRRKVDTDFRGDAGQFDQEYPASAELAFASSSPRALIKHALVAKARRARDVEALGPRIMGLDPAEYGDDWTSVTLRQGRVARRLDRWNGAGTMETVGRVALIADRHKPDLICCDATGVGTGVADRLKELGYPVIRVHFGESARDKARFGICRDEMWGLMADWLEDGPVSIEDDDDLAAQLTSVQYSYDSSRRLKLESKEKMKDRGLASPDDADSLALTFYPGVPAHTDTARAFRRLRGYAR